MSKHNPHACRALDAPFPVHGGHYTSTGRDLARAEPPAAEAPPATADTHSAARSGKKQREEHTHG